jgi:transcriptional regulator with XRE-family HTH domain
LRESTGLSGTAFSRQLGWVQSKVSKIETGAQTPSVEDIRRWAAAARADLDELLRPENDLRPILDSPRTIARDAVEDFGVHLLAEGPQVAVSSPDRRDPDLAVNVVQLDGLAAVHVIRYDYDPQLDAVPVLPELTVDLRLPRAFRQASAIAPTGVAAVTLEQRGPVHRLRLRDVGLYTVVVCDGG